MSEQMSLDTCHRDDGGNYIADDEVHPTTVWFANGRKVSIEHTEVKNEIEGGDAYLQIERELHPAFAAMQPPIGEPAAEPLKRITSVVPELLAILDSPDATEDEKDAAASTIVEAVAPDIMQKAYGEPTWDAPPPSESGQDLSNPLDKWLFFKSKKQTPARLMYHAFESGMYAGWQGARHQRDCPYKTNDYRMWWMHGCIVGNDRRELLARIDECESAAVPTDNKTPASEPVLSDLEIAAEQGNELTGDKLLADLEWLLAEGGKVAKQVAPELGRHYDQKLSAIRRIASGQTVGISLRYLAAIIDTLKAQPTEAAKLREDNTRLRSELIRADKESDELDTALRKLCEPVLGYDGAWGRGGVNADPIPGIEGVVEATITRLEAQVKELKQRHSGGNY